MTVKQLMVKYVSTNQRENRVMVSCTKKPIYVFPEMKLRGLVPNSYITHL